MKLLLGLAAALAAVAVAGAAPAAEGPPGVGDPAPDFRLTGSDGKVYTLSQFKGKSAVVIAWYPKALTGG